MKHIDPCNAACLVGLLLCLTLPGQGMAEEMASTPADGHAGAAPFGASVPTADLAGLRGGMVRVSNDMQLAGTTAGNVASQIETGTNTIAGGAFANAAGLPVVIQNSGANVLIQNATIVNLQLN